MLFLSRIEINYAKLVYKLVYFYFLKTFLQIAASDILTLKSSRSKYLNRAQFSQRLF